MIFRGGVGRPVSSASHILLVGFAEGEASAMIDRIGRADEGGKRGRKDGAPPPVGVNPSERSMVPTEGVVVVEAGDA